MLLPKWWLVVNIWTCSNQNIHNTAKVISWTTKSKASHRTQTDIENVPRVRLRFWEESQSSQNRSLIVFWSLGQNTHVCIYNSLFICGCYIKLQLNCSAESYIRQSKVILSVSPRKGLVSDNTQSADHWTTGRDNFNTKTLLPSKYED